MLSNWSRAAKTRLIGAGFACALMGLAGAAAPALAQERLEQDFGLIKACAGDVWRLCSDVLPDVGKHEIVHAGQDGPASQGLPRQASRRHGRVVIQGLQGSDLRALRRRALQRVRRGRLLPVRGEARRQHQPAVPDGQGR